MGPPGSCRPQMGPMLTPWTLLSGIVIKIKLTHWGRVAHMCVSNPIIIGSDNGLSPSRRQAIIETNAGILIIRPLGTNFREILIEVHIFSFKKMHFKWSSGKWRPFCPGLKVLRLPHSLSPLTCCNHVGDVYHIPNICRSRVEQIELYRSAICQMQRKTCDYPLNPRKMANFVKYSYIYSNKIYP